MFLLNLMQQETVDRSPDAEGSRVRSRWGGTVMPDCAKALA
jgi:hypothetical protein